MVVAPSALLFGILVFTADRTLAAVSDRRRTAERRERGRATENTAGRVAPPLLKLYVHALQFIDPCLEFVLGKLKIYNRTLINF